MQRDDYDGQWEEPEVERVDTGFRILFSLLFSIVFSLLETLIGAVVIFQLGYSLVTQRAPSEPVRDFGNRLSAYAYQIFRYLTHNSAERPFPFSDFPEALEPSDWPYAPRERRQEGEYDPERG